MGHYTIWRVNAIGEAFQIGQPGVLVDKKSAFETARLYSDRLTSSDPGSSDRFIVRNERGEDLPRE
ncbi:MAG: hypothetical protein HS115_12660 [Spirochaetales bacterium]|nr:hypothetical protein [Spirochaetales bacterium]